MRLGETCVEKRDAPGGERVRADMHEVLKEHGSDDRLKRRCLCFQPIGLLDRHENGNERGTVEELAMVRIAY